MPVTIHHPAVGRMRPFLTFPAHMHNFLSQMISDGDIRCVLHEGDHYIPLNDIEPYTVVELEGEDLDSQPSRLDQSAGAELLARIQVETNAAIQRDKAKLINFPIGAPNTSSNPFALTPWAGFWRDVARVGVALAGQGEAKRIAEAFEEIKVAEKIGTLEDTGLPHFHRVLLSVVDAALEAKFETIWSAGRGRLDMPKEPQKWAIALTAMERLTRMFSGYRGTPHGSETPQGAMDTYLSVTSFTPAR